MYTVVPNAITSWARLNIHDASNLFYLLDHTRPPHWSATPSGSRWKHAPHHSEPTVNATWTPSPEGLDARIDLPHAVRMVSLSCSTMVWILPVLPCGTTHGHEAAWATAWSLTTASRSCGSR